MVKWFLCKGKTVSWLLAICNSVTKSGRFTTASSEDRRVLVGATWGDVWLLQYGVRKGGGGSPVFSWQCLAVSHKCLVQIRLPKAQFLLTLVRHWKSVGVGLRASGRAKYCSSQAIYRLSLPFCPSKQCSRAHKTQPHANRGWCRQGVGTSCWHMGITNWAFSGSWGRQ